MSTEDVDTRLKQSFIRLYSSEHKVFVSALCKDAGISRNTFYEHYASMDSLVSDIRREILSDLMDYTGQYIDPESDGFDLDRYIDSGLEYISAHMEEFRAFIVDNHDEDFSRMWSHRISSNLRKLPGCRQDPVMAEMLSYALVGALSYAVRMGLSQNMTSAKAFFKNALGGLKG
ncbi:MAG: TetR/AcrR family transcriptional regulator [Candidatus Methanomethylophilaceae archaeon]|nr:TetR/AcrR family transcriptional regulator [Candidatus Methanomethylophilaceae archaeon]